MPLQLRNLDDCGGKEWVTGGRLGLPLMSIQISVGWLS